MTSVLALYSSGKTSGFVLDSGENVTHLVAIDKGNVIPNSITIAK